MPTASEHRRQRGFALMRIWTLATNTVTQLLRMRILVFLAIFAALAVAAAFAFPKMGADEQLKLLKDVVFGALQIFSIVIAIAATALLLPRDVEDRTLYTILSKPVPRQEYLVGKLLGVILLLGGALFFMDLIFSAVLYLKQSVIEAGWIASLQAEQAATPENIALVKADVAKHGLTWALHAGVWCVFLKASVVASLALLMSCIASSTLFTILVTFCFTIAGQGQGLLRSFALKALPVTWKKICAFVLAVVCPDLTLFDEVQAVIEGRVIPLQLLATMTGFAAAYVVLYTAVAYLVFAEIRGFLAGHDGVESYREAALKTGMNEPALRAAIHQMRKRYRTMIQQEIADTLVSPSDAEDEFGHLRRVLAGQFK